MGCFSGRLMSAASDQKLFCKLCSQFCCSFDEFVEEKVISPSYSSAILTPPVIYFRKGAYTRNRVIVQSLSCVWLWDPMSCSILGFPVHHHLLEFAQTHVHWADDATQASHPVTPFFSCSHSFPASGSFPVSQLFASGGQSIGASASVLPMNIRVDFLDWFDLLAVQGTLKSLLRYHSSKASILQHLAFFMVHLSHLYMTIPLLWLYGPLSSKWYLYFLIRCLGLS